MKRPAIELMSIRTPCLRPAASLFSAILLVPLALLPVATAQASIVVGGSSLLTSTYLQQLETWLGEGPVTLTNIFTKTQGDGKNSAAFHAAADGQGRTFTVVQVVSGYGGQQIIGGYNPMSWDTSNSYHVQPTNVGRDAFLFNLTNPAIGIERQSLNSSVGQYQTANYIGYGPTFGGGRDLFISSNLTSGYVRDYSYGEVVGDNGPNLVGYSGGTSSLQFGTIEVFTIANGVNTSAPEPTTFAVWTLLGLATSSLSHRRRCRG